MSSRSKRDGLGRWQTFITEALQITGTPYRHSEAVADHLHGLLEVRVRTGIDVTHHVQVIVIDVDHLLAVLID